MKDRYALTYITSVPAELYRIATVSIFNKMQIMYFQELSP